MFMPPGKFNGTPVSIISTNMGMPNMDFVVRESRAVVEGQVGGVMGIDRDNWEGSLGSRTEGDRREIGLGNHRELSVLPCADGHCALGYLRCPPAPRQPG